MTSQRTVIVTGGARGMGSFARQSLRQSRLPCRHRRCRAGGGARRRDQIRRSSACAWELDVTQPPSWKTMVDRLAETAPPLFGLVNNAGVIHRQGIADTSDEDWRRVMSVNLDGAFYGMREIGPRLVANGGGAIVNVSSIGGLIGYHSARYGASKWALRGLSKTAAGEFGPGNVRVNSIHPGRIETEMVEPDSKTAASFLERVPLGRGGQPEEVSSLVVFLMSPEAGYLNGSEISIDGGSASNGTFFDIGSDPK